MIIKCKKRQILTLFPLTVLVIILISSCDRTDHYKLDGLYATPYKIVEINDDIINYQYYVVEELVKTNNTKEIRYDSLIIDIATSTYIAQNNNTNLNLGIKEAKAVKKDKTHENLSDIIITSDKDYSVNYPAGTNLADIVLIRLGHGVTGMKINEYLSYSNSVMYISTINFIQPPSTEEIHNLSIKYVTEDKREIITTVENLFIGS